MHKYKNNFSASHLFFSVVKHCTPRVTFITWYSLVSLYLYSYSDCKVLVFSTLTERDVPLSSTNTVLNSTALPPCDIAFYHFSWFF